MHGHHSPKADIVVAKDASSLEGNRDYVLVVEAKAEHVTISPDDFWQGESYARAVGCEFLIAHNEKETRAFRLVAGAPGSRLDIEDAPRLEDLADEKRLQAIRVATKAFSRDEFRKLLHECHTILRDNHKLDPGAAFDEISKVLFIKMFFERGRDAARFTRDFIDRYADIRRHRREEVMNDLFDDTKQGLEGERLFGSDDKVNVSYATFRRLVEKLERFNLSGTSEDVKGIAFEQFLGQTFRGDLGQFFTPRPVVDFMVELVDPREGELICDPASGTGGFLIKAFEYVRDQIERSVQEEKDATVLALSEKASLEDWDDEAYTAAITDARVALNQHLDMEKSSSRLGRLSRESLFGADAEARAARTSKMNMIMHGDGHGGIYFHDGLLDTGGLLEGRFDVVLTNPPFGASVSKDQKAGETEQTQMVSPANAKAHEDLYGEAWESRRAVLKLAERDRVPILDLFDIGRDPVGGPQGTARVRNSRPTELLFVERAINLVKPGGRIAVVLPDGTLNNPSLQWFRDYVETRARLLAVVSLPQSVFASAKATVKTSIVLLQRLNAEEIKRFQKSVEQARVAAETEFKHARSTASAELRNLLSDAGVVDPDAAVVAHLAVSRAYSSNDREAEVKEARKAFNRLLNAQQRKIFREGWKRRTNMLREVDEQQESVALVRARQNDDYPVFMAEVEAAGITSSGATGAGVPNELPEVLAAYRAWTQEHKPDCPQLTVSK
jgi:type I restriction enzyme M protein